MLAGKINLHQIIFLAKANELDERIPFISKLKKYAALLSHPEINTYKTEEFRNAEIKLI